MADTFVTAVIGVDEEFFPALWKSGCINRETVILGSDVTLSRDHAGTGDVVASVTKLHLDRVGTNSPGEQLVSETDTEDGDFAFLHSLGDVLHSSGDRGWVTGTVGEEETVIFASSEGMEIVIPRNDQDFNTT